VVPPPAAACAGCAACVSATGLAAVPQAASRASGSVAASTAARAGAAGRRARSRAPILCIANILARPRHGGSGSARDRSERTAMRKIILMMSVSLDGFFEGPDRQLDWQLVDAELHGHFNEWLAPAAALLDRGATHQR